MYIIIMSCLILAEAYLDFSILQAAGKSFIPKMLGLGQQGPCTVFDSHLIPASMMFSDARSPGFINKDSFVRSVGEGLQYLHERKLVHMDLCLDSILVNEVRTLTIYLCKSDLHYCVI